MSLHSLTLLEPFDEWSKHAGYWQEGLEDLLDEGRRVCYTDGTERGGKRAGAIYWEDIFYFCFYIFGTHMRYL